MVTSCAEREGMHTQAGTWCWSWHSDHRVCGALCTVRRRALQQNTMGRISDSAQPSVMQSLYHQWAELESVPWRGQIIEHMFSPKNVTFKKSSFGIS